MDREEFSAAIKKLGFYTSEEELQFLINHLDEEKSGFISRRIFIKKVSILAD